MDNPAHSQAGRGSIDHVSAELVRRAELLRRVAGRANLDAALRAGAWHRVVRDVYAEGAGPDDLRQRARALGLVTPPGAVVAGRSALWLHGVDVQRSRRRGQPPPLELAVPPDCTPPRRPGVVVRRQTLPAHDLTDRHGVLVLQPVRAVVDLLRAEPLVEGVVVADAATNLGVVSLSALVMAVAAVPSRGRGVRRAAEALTHVEPLSESPMESRLRMLLVLGGLPRPRAQVQIWAGGVLIGRVDLYYDGLCLEFDGREARLDPRAFVRERNRQNQILQAGYRMLRFTAPDVFVTPARTLSVVGEARLVMAGFDAAAIDHAVSARR